ncbi:MAG TPA: hypothetical protein VG838_18345 [Opitutaceae bacterium]|nr:hypothetical protein [Opitutaceae bacterium]
MTGFPLSLLTAGVLLGWAVLPAPARANLAAGKIVPPDSAVAPALGSAQHMVINGSVDGTSARERSLTVDGKAVRVSPATAIVRSGQAIRLDDINVGDKVAVTAIRDVAGGIQAVTIVVLSGEIWSGLPAAAIPGRA